MPDIARATVKQLADKIRGPDPEKHSPRFAFLLGAGCSRQSGIITASEMIAFFKDRILEVECPQAIEEPHAREEWVHAQAWYKEPGSEYCKLFEHYEPKELGRQRYIESIIEGRKPSFGYLVLANLMVANYVNTVLTTNFDDLVYGACTMYSDIRPIVYAYGVLASEMRISTPRPRILKLHGDYLYSRIKNTKDELKSQDPNMTRQVSQLLSEYGLVVVGYGGGDKSVMRLLSKISPRNDLYWCVPENSSPSQPALDLLSKKNGLLVEIRGYDEFMNDLRIELGLKLSSMIGSLERRQDELVARLKKDGDYSKDILPEIVEALQAQVDELTTRQNKIKALDAFAKALQADDGEDAGKKQAEALYREAIRLDPTDAVSYNNLAYLLYEDPDCREDAERWFLQAIRLDPTDADYYNNLGNLLIEIPGREKEAEQWYRKAIHRDPRDPLFHYNLACLLSDEGNRRGEAERLFRTAIELDPTDADYDTRLASLIGEQPGRLAEAEALCRKALEVDPKNATAYYELASLLIRDTGRHAQARELYRQAIQLDPAEADSYPNLVQLFSSDRDAGVSPSPA